MLLENEQKYLTYLAEKKSESKSIFLYTVLIYSIIVISVFWSIHIFEEEILGVALFVTAIGISASLFFYLTKQTKPIQFDSIEKVSGIFNCDTTRYDAIVSLDNKNVVIPFYWTRILKNKKIYSGSISSPETNSFTLNRYALKIDRVSINNDVEHGLLSINPNLTITGAVLPGIVIFTIVSTMVIVELEHYALCIIPALLSIFFLKILFFVVKGHRADARTRENILQSYS